MNRISGFFLGVAAITGLAYGQTSLSQAVDFSVTDAQGNAQNLFSYLNAGKYVLLEFAATQ